MAQPVPYSYTHVRVPPGFGVILEDLAREVLRDQPKDIPSYAAQHFNALLKARDESGEDPVEWAARLESRFNNKLSSKKPMPGPAAAQSRLVAEPPTSPDHAGHKEPSEDIQSSSEAITLSPLATDQEVALDSTADTGAETADETTEPPAEAQYGGMADVDICAKELQGSGLGESKMGGETEEEKVEDIDENVEDVVEAGVGHGEEDKEEEKGRGDEEGEEAGKKGEEFEEETREEEEEVNKASKPDEEEANKGDEEVEEPGVGGREEETEEETEEGKGEYNVDEARQRDEAQVEVEKVSSSAHTDADNICKAELDPSPEAPIGGLANVDVCAAELHGQPEDQDPVSEASIKEDGSPQASESQIEEKELSASQVEMESSDIKAESPEHSQALAKDDGSEVTAEQRTYFEGQYEEEPEQETSAISDVSQEHRSEQEEPEAEAKISGSADAYGEPGPGGTDREVGLCDDGEGERSQGDGDGEHRHGDDDVEQHSHGDGEPGLSVETDWEGQASRTEADIVSGYDELAPEDMSKEEEEENVCPASDSHVADTDTDKPESYKELSQPEEKSEGHVSTSRAEGDHGDDHTAEHTQRDREEGEIVEEEEEGDKDNEVSETDRDVHKSTLQDGSDDEGDATQATDQLDEQALISEQTYSSATHTRSAGEERDPDMEEGSVESVEQPGSREPTSDEKPDGEGKEPKKGSSEKPEVESSPEVSHSSEQEASEGVRDLENKQREAVSEELDEVKNTSKQEGEVERDQSLQEEGVVGETECTGESSPEQSLSDPAGSEPAAAETAEKHSAESDFRTQTPNSAQDESREHSQDQSEYAEERGAGEESCDDKGDSKEECNQPGDEEDIMDIPLDDPEANRAAAKIQAGFRGHMTRKKMPRKEGEKGDEVSSSGEALNGNQGNTGASEEAESEGTSAPEQ